MSDETSPRPAEDQLGEPADGDQLLDDELGDDRGGEPADGDLLGEAQDAIAEARRRVAEAPADLVVSNHVMGLYELAAIHLSTPTPDLLSAALAIDAMALLVDGLGDRLGATAATMRDALANIRMAFVQIKATVTAAPSAASPDGAEGGG